MSFTSKDFVGTLLAGAAVLVGAAVMNDWGWPLLGDYRAGTVALAVIGVGMCAAGSDYSTVRWSHPLVILASALGVAALGLIVAGLIWATAEIFFWLAFVIVALWMTTTLRHLTTPRRLASGKAIVS
jgi:peptidoglycan/LPS O-acetylase OafA/YrhL